MLRELIEKLTDQVGKLGFGFSLGSGLGGISYLVIKSFYPQTNIEPDILFYSGGAIGFALNQIIERAYDWIIRPVTRAIGFYTSIGHILLLKKIGLIDESKAKLLVDNHVNNYLLKPTGEGDKKLLPSSTSGDASG
jgi:hypothetical protein